MTDPLLGSIFKNSKMNSNELVTKHDLNMLKAELMAEFRKLFSKPELSTGFFKSKDIKKILGCNDSTLQYYRDSGHVKFKKIGGTYYYPKEDFLNPVEK